MLMWGLRRTGLWLVWVTAMGASAGCERNAAEVREAAGSDSPGPLTMDRAVLRPPAPTATVDTSVLARTALVVGNADYKEGPLKNPVNDALDMSRALGQLGFEVIEVFNGSQNTIKRAMIDFGELLRARQGVGLFYYAGHGLQVNGRNYLIPIDARIASEALVDVEAVSADRVLAEMDAASTRVNLVILDACRNNPFARSFRSPSQGLAFMDAPSGTLIAYATAPGRTASDGMGRNGVYTSALLQHLHDETLSIEQLLKRVGGEVEAKSDGQQSPWHASSLRGEFLFAAKNGPNSSPPAPVKEEPGPKTPSDEPPGTPWGPSSKAKPAPAPSGAAGAGSGTAGAGGANTGGAGVAGSDSASVPGKLRPDLTKPGPIKPSVTQPTIEVDPSRYRVKEVTPVRPKPEPTAVAPAPSETLTLKKRLPAQMTEAAP